MNIDFFAKSLGRIIGMSVRKLNDGYKDLREGYDEGLKIECPVCKKIFSKHNVSDLESIRKNKMCGDCFSNQSGVSRKKIGSRVIDAIYDIIYRIVKILDNKQTFWLAMIFFVIIFFPVSLVVLLIAIAVWAIPSVKK